MSPIHIIIYYVIQVEEMERQLNATIASREEAEAKYKEVFI